MQQASSIQDLCSPRMSHGLALCSWSSANENEVMEILAAIVTDVERDTSQDHNIPFLQHTYSPPNVLNHAECWAKDSSWLGNKGCLVHFIFSPGQSKCQMSNHTDAEIKHANTVKSSLTVYF